jgi:hypothetical protein
VWTKHIFFIFSPIFLKTGRKLYLYIFYTLCEASKAVKSLFGNRKVIFLIFSWLQSINHQYLRNEWFF